MPDSLIWHRFSAWHAAALQLGINVRRLVILMCLDEVTSLHVGLPDRHCAHLVDGCKSEPVVSDFSEVVVVDVVVSPSWADAVSPGSGTATEAEDIAVVEEEEDRRLLFDGRLEVSFTGRRTIVCLTRVATESPSSPSSSSSLPSRPPNPPGKSAVAEAEGTVTSL